MQNLGSYGSSNNFRSQQSNLQVTTDLVMKLIEAQQVIFFSCYTRKIILI